MVLEVFDTFLFDRLYATFLPKAIAQLNATADGSILPGIYEAPTLYEPASQFIHLKSSPYAYSSKLLRNDPYRQTITLYLITW